MRMRDSRLSSETSSVLEARRIDQRQVDVADAAGRIAAVARHAGTVVHERELLAGQPVEQGRLAHVGPADDGDAQGHEAFPRVQWRETEAAP